MDWAKLLEFERKVHKIAALSTASSAIEKDELCSSVDELLGQLEAACGEDGEHWEAAVGLFRKWKTWYPRLFGTFYAQDINFEGSSSSASTSFFSFHEEELVKDPINYVLEVDRNQVYIGQDLARGPIHPLILSILNSAPIRFPSNNDFLDSTRVLSPNMILRDGVLYYPNADIDVFEGLALANQRPDIQAVVMAIMKSILLSEGLNSPDSLEVSIAGLTEQIDVLNKYLKENRSSSLILGIINAITAQRRNFLDILERQDSSRHSYVLRNLDLQSTRSEY